MKHSFLFLALLAFISLSFDTDAFSQSQTQVDTAAKSLKAKPPEQALSSVARGLIDSAGTVYLKSVDGIKFTTASGTVTLPATSTGSFSTHASAYALTPGTTVTYAPGASKSLATLTPAQSETINATTTNAIVGKTYYIKVTTSGTSSYTLTFSTNFKTTGTLATGTSSAKVFILAFVFDGSTFNEVSRTTAM